jgi:hypothetical protein
MAVHCVCNGVYIPARKEAFHLIIFNGDSEESFKVWDDVE